MVLEQLQALLSRLYDVPNEYAVADFLMTDNARLNVAVPCSTDEQVLVRESDGNLQVSVYVADDVLSRLAGSNPIDALGDANLSDYCTALEGVSHFHYLTWRARRSESVSLLELELQAEVDKYATAVWLLTAQRSGHLPRLLHERLFHCVRYHETLDAQCVARYRTANRYAAQFCRRLEERFLRKRRVEPENWLRELRRFYRLSHTQKLRCIAA